MMIELKVAGQKVVPSSSPILVYGETGTGKEHLIQERSFEASPKSYNCRQLDRGQQVRCRLMSRICRNYGRGICKINF
ncbi:MAG: sigma-54 factor interaction domain-containing protein [Firmicutes bacterium]|nr:sigma-54 factor interaction domain-containing protein [Bacillota bacterium]